MAVPDTVLRLVERFHQNAVFYCSEHYSAAQVRVDFIDPLFEALGWDIANRRGLPQDQRDVIYEDALKVRMAPKTLEELPLFNLLNRGDNDQAAASAESQHAEAFTISGRNKAPDYGFRIGGVRKFFLEAKKPSVNIKGDIQPAFQLRRYGWSAHLPLSILTDFEEFAVYDCRVIPKRDDKATTARIKYLTYTEYADNWDELYALFSREAVLGGALDIYAEAARTHKGVATVDAAFLKEIEAWRAELAHNIAVRNTHLNQRELNDAVQITLERIIFLRICEDRGIEPYGRLQILGNSEQIYTRLGHIFRQAGERYNSGLFHFKQKKGRAATADDWTLKLEIEDEPLKKILKQLYYPDSPFEFSVLPVELLGQVYEQFLGKVVRLSSNRRVEVAEKPEVRKAGGVYYTPSYIVDYIVRNTIGKLLAGKTPKQAARLRIMDPACGSGCFLLGAYQFLLDWHRERYLSDGPEKHSKQLYEASGGVWQLTSAEREQIVLNNIYGVDIDRQAVEVTKLSLLLKVLEGETEQTLAPQLRLLQERALPDLGSNIKCGNSLIGPDYYAHHQMSFLDEEERFRINVFGWEDGFPAIMQEGGFDAIIGNPPWVFTRDVAFGALAKDYFARHYIGAQGKVNLYVLFIHRGTTLLKNGGCFSMIVPNTFLRATSYQPLREHILQEYQFEKIADAGTNVFKGVTASTIILFIRRAAPQANLEVSKVNALAADFEVSSVDRARLLANDGVVIDLFVDRAAGQIVDRIKSTCEPLARYAQHLISGIQTWKQHKRHFIAESLLNDEYKPLLEGKDIGRYQHEFRNKYIWYSDKVLNVMQDENIFLLPEKILIQRISGGLRPLKATLDRDQFYCFNSINTLVCHSIDHRYILGILNSTLMSWLYGIKFSNRSELTVNIANRNLQQLPIRPINISNANDTTQHNQIVELVERMLVLNKQLATAKTRYDRTFLQRQREATDKHIDRLVYELYALTEDEIQIVEAGTKSAGVAVDEQ